MSTKKKAWRGRAVYERLLEQRRREGLTFSELSQRSGVPIGTLQRWGRRLGREETAPKQPFVELVSAPPTRGQPVRSPLPAAARPASLPAALSVATLSPAVPSAATARLSPVVAAIPGLAATTRRSRPVLGVIAGA